MKRRIAFALACVALSGALVWQRYRAAVGTPGPALAAAWNRGHRIVDRHGALLFEQPSGIGARGRPLPLEAIGDRLVCATLAAEDKRFFSHGGVDGAAIVRAIGQNAAALGVVSGASTITQQLVKLLDSGGRPESSQRTAAVKLREAARAQNLEEQLDKKAILEAYLNRLSYGRNLVGPEAAAQAYFGVGPRDLSWAQAAYLAVLPRAPSMLDPYRHPDRGKRRQEGLLHTLFEAGVLSADDLARSLAEPIAPAPLSPAFEAPHLVASLTAGAHGGLGAGEATETTLDLPLQHDVEGLVRTHAQRLARERASGAAVVVVDNDSGEVLAYVGGPRYGDEDGERIDMANAARQPGSALKPFVYALAFARGLQPSEMLPDVPTSFGEASGAYAPGNFDGAFHGPVSAREALAGSLNVPAVRLAAQLPDDALLALLRALGITSLDRGASYYGLSLALGSGEVSLFELAQAYAVLARGGSAVALTVTPRPGPFPEPAQLIAPSVAAAISDSLSDPLARVRGLGGAGPFDVGFPVAVKTGTSSGHKDSWTIGYTRERTVAVWAGNPDGRATAELTGGSGAGPLFADVMRRAMADAPTRLPLYDDGLLEEHAVCPLSGKRAGPACSEAVTRRLIPGADHDSCDLHRHASPRAAAHEPPFRCDARGGATIVVLPATFDDWLAQQPLGAPGRDPFGLPVYSATRVPGCSDAQLSSLSVESPAAGSVLLAGNGATLELAAALAGPARALPVEFVLDGKVIARADTAPYRAHVLAEPGDHLLLVRPVDPLAAVRLGESRFSVR